MAVKKITFDGNTLIDLTSDTVTAATMLSGKTAHIADGTIATGTIATKTASDMTASGATITAPAGYYASNASKSIANGSATTPATTITTAPTISISSAGLITASYSSTQSITPTVSAGYVSSGTAGTITVSGSNTKQMTVKAAKTWTPTTSNQTIAASTYLTGAQTIAGSSYLKAANIKKGVTIFGVTGTYSAAITYGKISSASSLPSTVTNNKIVVITSTAITSWTTSNVAPSSPSTGAIWMKISDQGDGNAIDLNGDGTLMLSPDTIYQYNGSSWVEKSYYVGKDGTWISNTLVLMENGVDKTNSGWTMGNTTTNATFTQGTNYWQFAGWGTSYTTNESYSNTYNTVNINGKGSICNGYAGSRIQIVNTSGTVLTKKELTTTQSDISLDISNYKGQNIKVQWYVYGTTSYGYLCTATAYKIWLK